MFGECTKILYARSLNSGDTKGIVSTCKARVADVKLEEAKQFMPVEGIKCDRCGSSDVMEYKPDTFLCRFCDHTFKYIDPTRSLLEIDVVPQFCEEGCGNPVHFTCSLCGKRICKGHGERAKVLLSRMLLNQVAYGSSLMKTTLPELQQAWCIKCAYGLDAKTLAGNLAAALNDNSPEVREATVYALRNLGGPLAGRYICQRLRDVDSGVRLAAAAALADLGDPSTVSDIGAALGDSNLNVRIALVKALEATKDSAAIPYLGRYINDPLLRAHVIEALRKIGGAEAVPHLGKALLEKANMVELLVAIVEIGDWSATPFLIDALRKYMTKGIYANREEIAGIVTTLGLLGDASAIPALIDLTRIPQDSYTAEIRKSTIEALNRLGTLSGRGEGADAIRSMNSRARIRLILRIVAAIAAIILIAILIGQCVSSFDSEGILKEHERPTLNVNSINNVHVEELPRSYQLSQPSDENRAIFTRSPKT